MEKSPGVKLVQTENKVTSEINPCTIFTRKNYHMDFNFSARKIIPSSSIKVKYIVT